MKTNTAHASETKKSTRKIPFKLNSSEVVDRAKQAARLVDEIIEDKDVAKEAAKEAKSAIEKKETRLVTLSESVRKEPDPDECDSLDDDAEDLDDDNFGDDEDGGEA